MNISKLLKIQRSNSRDASRTDREYTAQTGPSNSKAAMWFGKSANTTRVSFLALSINCKIWWPLSSNLLSLWGQLFVESVWSPSTKCSSVSSESWNPVWIQLSRFFSKKDRTPTTSFLSRQISAWSRLFRIARSRKCCKHCNCKTCHPKAGPTDWKYVSALRTLQRNSEITSFFLRIMTSYLACSQITCSMPVRKSGK